jgi:aminotransferase
MRALRNGRTRYPDNRGEPRLREAVAARLQHVSGLRCDPGSEILITTGATLGIQAALFALLNDGDEVLLPDPVYDAYTSPLLMAGGRPRTVRARVHEDRFVITPEAVEAAVTSRTRVLLLNTPWNPVGTVFREAELRALMESVIRHDLVLISDEIYEAITYGGRRHVSPAVLSPEARARTVLINSLSKTYAMTGWRIGFSVAPPAVTQAMFLVLQQASRGPATFVQDAAVAALEGSQAPVEQMRLEYERRRTQVIDGLRGLSRARILAPEGGFFAMVDVREAGIPSAEIRRDLLRRNGVAVVHGAAYGEGGEGTLRVSFGSGGQTLTQGLSRLREGLAHL